MIATITTSNRLDLFKRTLTSFREKCLDWGMIKEIQVYDDSSSTEDRKEMEQMALALAPNRVKIHYAYLKSHLDNLNRIVGVMPAAHSLGVGFILHLEDDWELIRPGCPILAALDVMYNDPSVGQVIFGRAEALENAPLAFVTPTGTQYVRLLPFNASDRYCPFTLNPGLWRVDAFRKTGLFEGENFEYTYGGRFSALGWRTAHLYPANLHHIGHGNSAYDITGAKR